MPGHYQPAYYAMKRAAQQRLTQGWDPAALLLMDDLRAWWHCADKQRTPATDIWRQARRYHRRLQRTAQEVI